MKVLVVEDDTDVRVSICEILAENGVISLEAASGERALEVLQAQPQIDAILLDLTMPGMGGVTLRQTLLHHAELRHIPVVVVSGRPLHGADRARLSPAAYLQKPFDERELLAALESARRTRS